jgi:serine/threonine protein kinase
MSPPVVHGDVKAVSTIFSSHVESVEPKMQSNIVVDGFGNPLIADFGLSRVSNNITRWMILLRCPR